MQWLPAMYTKYLTTSLKHTQVLFYLMISCFQFEKNIFMIFFYLELGIFTTLFDFLEVFGKYIESHQKRTISKYFIFQVCNGCHRKGIVLIKSSSKPALLLNSSYVLLFWTPLKIPQSTYTRPLLLTSTSNSSCNSFPSIYLKDDTICHIIRSKMSHVTQLPSFPPRTILVSLHFSLFYISEEEKGLFFFYVFVCF